MNTHKNLIIVNPKSGLYNSQEKLNYFITNYLKDESFQIITTNNKSSLSTIIKDIDNYKNILLFGGDGTISSIVQYVIKKNISIGHIPTGSGNGLTNSLLYTKSIKLTNDLNPVYQNLANAIKNEEIHMIDTMTVQMLDSSQTIHSFLFLSCGIFSNLDLNTEWMRMLGEIRFVLGAIYELIKYFFFGNSVSGELEYLDDDNIKISEKGEFVFFLASNNSHTSRTSITSPYSKPNDGYIYLSYLKEPTNTWTLLKVLLGLDDGSYINKLKYRRTKWFTFTPTNGIYDIDGERYDIEPIEVSLNPKSLRILY